MNEEVAYTLIDAELRRLRGLPYAELIQMVAMPETKQVIGEDGNSYQIEIEVIRDIDSSDDVRVIVSADDDGWRVFMPLTRDFIMRPDGSILSSGD
ncbi:MAG: hypothetical protein ACLQVL_37925 [Terriglobia bacterium]